MPRAVWLLVIGMAINVTGSSFLWPLNTIYMNGELGKSLTVAGIVLMLNSIATIIGNLFGGTIFDKIGGYRSILLGCSISMLALIGLNVWNTFIPYTIFLSICGFGGGIIFPAMYALAGTVWPEGGRKTFNAIYIAQNVGVALGAALAGIIANISFQLAFLGNLMLLTVFFFIALFGYKNLNANVVKNKKQEQVELGNKNYASMISLLTVCVAFLLCWVGYVQWQTTIATYTQEINISLEQYSLLWTINGAMIVFCQPLLAPIVKRIKSLKTQIVVGLVIFMISYVVTSIADQFTMFVAGMVILTLGEMFVWPVIPTIAAQLAPKGKEGFYQGVVNSTGTVGKMIGPILGGYLVDHYGMGTMFLIMPLLLIIGIATTLVYDKPLKGKIKEAA